jgi:CheY-like chemotaxis protein
MAGHAADSVAPQIPALSVDYQIVGEAGSSARYDVTCQRCATPFDATVVPWCACGAQQRTLVCPHCLQCFCTSPVLYRERFWADAPRTLREHTSRFRLRDGLPANDRRSGLPHRVLIVDDEEAMRSLVACYVEQMGYDVTTVSSPKEALAIFSPDSFEVVVTDALMPGMDGRELCRKIKDEYGLHIKVILMTSLYTANRFRAEARHRFGVDEYLNKPLNFSDLKAALDRVVADL